MVFSTTVTISNLESNGKHYTYAIVIVMDVCFASVVKLIVIGGASGGGVFVVVVVITIAACIIVSCRRRRNKPTSTQ